MSTIDPGAPATTTADHGFGITPEGFVSKPLARLLDEKIAACQRLFGDDIDLTSGSMLRKLAELMCVEEARMWDHLSAAYADSFVATATGDALSMLGAELGVPRPHHRATGAVTIKLNGDLPAEVPAVLLVRGTRLLTSGGHDYFITGDVHLDQARTSVEVGVTAFQPGPAMNLDAASPNQVLGAFHEGDDRSWTARRANDLAGQAVVAIEHTQPTSGGERYWADEPYRDLVLGYPRNLWSPDAVRVAVARVPGVRQVIVSDRYGGLDIHQSIFGNFSFAERLFSEERSLGSPYYFTVLVAPGEGALWLGPGQLLERVGDAIDAVRPVGIRPKIEQASVVSVGLSATVRVDGIPLPVGLAGPAGAAGTSPEAAALRGRILDRIRRYVATLAIGEPVRHAEMVWAVMEEPGVVDVREVRLRRDPATLQAKPGELQQLGAEENAPIAPTEVAELVDTLCHLVIT